MGRNGKFDETVPTTEIEPLVVPLEAGVKLTAMLALSPACKISGRLCPVKLNPWPEVAIRVTVTGVLPVLDNVAG
jgi:hypothetical protein